MKNIVKLFSVMFVAGAMMLVSCEPEPEPGPEGPVTPKYTITVTANDAAYGTVTGGGEYDSAATATLTATPNEGYKFVNWNDGNESNPRIITVTANATYTANFAEIAGVNVTFGDNSWTAQYTNALYYPNAVMVAASQTTNPQQNPIINLTQIWSSGNNASTGTLNGNSSIDVNTGNVSINYPLIWYYETPGNTINLTYSDSSSVKAGDWWSKDITLNITTLDADNMTLSLVANATMGRAYDLVDGSAANWNTISTRSLTLNVINQSMTQGTKGFLQAHRTAKIAR